VAGRGRGGGATAGVSLLELLVVLALLGILVQAGATSLVRWRGRQELEAAVRGAGLALQRACALAVASGRIHGLWFEQAAGDPGGLGWRLVADGDGDGILSADLAAGIDVPLEPTQRLSSLHPGVVAGLPAGVPTLHGGAAGSGGVAFGSSSVVSCSPGGGARSGTLYLASREGGAAALRVYGPTGRISRWWWDRQLGDWVELG
jgi:prepilin-type N-terminal cleavage/methylation domain-containing protein